MATNIYGNGTTTATAGSNTIVHYYDKAGVKAANEVNVYGQWADRKSMPLNMGKTFKISKFLHIYDRELTDTDFSTKGFLTARDIADVSAGLTATDGSGASLTEGAGATNKRSIKKITMETSFARYGEMIDYTDEVAMFSEDVIQVRYREELGRLANRREEDLIQLDMLATTNVMYAGTATSVATVGTGLLADGSLDGLFKTDYDLVRKAVRKLVRNRADKNTEIVSGSTKIDTRTINKAFYAIIGPEIKYDLESLTRGSGAEAEFVYVPVYKYASVANLAEGEVGAIQDMRFIESESAVVYAGQGAAVPALYTGDLSYTANAASLIIQNTTGSAVDITDVVATNPYGTSIAAGAYVTTTLEAHAAALDAVAGLARSLGKFDVYPILVPTKGSFATVGLKGYNKITFNAQSPEKIELTNPYGTNGFFSYTMWYAGIILQPEKLLKILVAASA